VGGGLLDGGIDLGFSKSRVERAKRSGRVTKGTKAALKWKGGDIECATAPLVAALTCRALRKPRRTMPTLSPDRPGRAKRSRECYSAVPLTIGPSLYWWRIAEEVWHFCVTGYRQPVTSRMSIGLKQEPL
jgi:hypothetical protein